MRGVGMSSKPMFTSEYETRLAEALEKQERIKHEIKFLRLQIKQERQQERWCKGSPDIKELCKQFPEHRIDNGAGLTYFAVDLSVLDALPALPDEWVAFDRHVIHPSSISSPVCTKYRKNGVPAHLYITKAVC